MIDEELERFLGKFIHYIWSQTDELWFNMVTRKTLRYQYHDIYGRMDILKKNKKLLIQFYIDRLLESAPIIEIISFHTHKFDFKLTPENCETIIEMVLPTTFRNLDKDIRGIKNKNINGSNDGLCDTNLAEKLNAK